MQLQRKPSAFAGGWDIIQLNPNHREMPAFPARGLGGGRESPVHYLTITNPFRDRQQASLIARHYALLAT